MSSDPTSARPQLQLILKSLLRADAIMLFKGRRSLILSIALPIILLVITDKGKLTTNVGGGRFIVGLCICYGLMSTALMGYSVLTAQDRERGVFQRLRVTPAPTWAIMTSRLAVRLLASLIIALVVVIVGSQMHKLHLSIGEYVLVLAVSVLAGAVFLSIGQALVALVRSADTVNAAARILYIGLIFLGVLGLSGALGSTLDSISTWTPVGITMTLFAGVIKLSAWATNDTESVLAAIGYVVVFTAIGVRWFKWDSR
ncbi:MAG: ABC transporter permease [Solirubrobacteraceae bacterium]